MIMQFYNRSDTCKGSLEIACCMFSEKKNRLRSCNFVAEGLHLVTCLHLQVHVQIIDELV